MTVTLYAYKDRLAGGFDRGLNQSLIDYGLDVPRTADFDIMQSKLECCGNHKFTDWNNLNPPRPVPRSCCIRPACNVEDDMEIYQTVSVFYDFFYMQLVQMIIDLFTGLL